MFTRVYHPSDLLYRIAVFGQVTNNYFMMIYLEKGWQFSKPEHVADWIKQVESELKETLKANHIA